MAPLFWFVCGRRALGVRLPAAGARSISFSAEKETGLDSKEKVRPVYGGLVVEDGGLRLYALW